MLLYYFLGPLTSDVKISALDPITYACTTTGCVEKHVLSWIYKQLPDICPEKKWLTLASLPTPLQNSCPGRRLSSVQQQFTAGKRSAAVLLTGSSSVLRANSFYMALL